MKIDYEKLDETYWNYFLRDNILELLVLPFEITRIIFN